MTAHYFEFSEEIVEAGLMPSTLCCVIGREHDSRMFNVMALADRVYRYEGNRQVEIKNRNGIVRKVLISDADKIVLKLKAVLL